MINFLQDIELGEKIMPNTMAYLKKDINRMGGNVAYQSLLEGLHRFFGMTDNEMELDATSVLMYYNIIFRIRACRKDPKDWSPGSKQ